MINVLHLGLSYNCNLNCKHCFVNRGDDLLTTDNIKSIIDELEKKGLFFLIFTYGEPLLSPNYYEISDYAKSKNIIRTLMTNGTYINEKNYKKISLSAERIFISLDSSSAYEHDINRGSNGTFNKCIKAIKLLKETNSIVGISTTVTQKNWNRLSEIYQLATSLDVDEISFLRERKNGYICKFNDIEYSAYKDVIFSNIKNIKPKLIFHDCTLNKYINFMYKEKNISNEEYIKFIDYSLCKNYRTLAIEPNGNVRFCNISGKVIGNVIDSNIDKILGGDNFESFSCLSKVSR